MNEIIFALGLGMDQGKAKGIIEAEKKLTPEISLKYHHHSNLDNGLIRDREDKNIFYIVVKF